MEEITKVVTCHSIAQITYYQNVLDEESGRRQEETLEDSIDMQDEAYSVLAMVCRSPYRDAMETVLESAVVEGLAQYEELTDEEKELYLKENSLEQEYEQAAQEDYTIEYGGEEWNFARFEAACLTGTAILIFIRPFTGKKTASLVKFIWSFCGCARTRPQWKSTRTMPSMPTARDM
jgi:hypothetical protein